MSEREWRPGNPVSRVARAAARELATDHGPELAAQVEAALHERRAGQAPTQFFDPVSLGSLIVSIAALSWTVYKDLRAKAATSTKDAVAVRVRVELTPSDHVPQAQRDRVIDVVTEEVIRDAAEDN
ncbi:MAG TPA: hypothetical protein VH352_12805 [Pseudonocardiaceae bacterium]|jgi:hypothetical protein|nr:hypothetical protein [Pseudonocardiaceae bacterium]